MSHAVAKGRSLDRVQNLRIDGRRFDPSLTNFFPRTNPLPHNKILDMSNLNQIADDILKCI